MRLSLPVTAVFLLVTVRAFAGPIQFRSEFGRAGAGSESVFIGVMGQVAQPGVYEVAGPNPLLSQVTEQAGGLTQQATGTIRIVRAGRVSQQVFLAVGSDVPLAAGDILVADSQPNHAAAGSTRSPIAVALVGIASRPVILPVPAEHAHPAALVAFLGQSPQLASSVHALPVGPLRRSSRPDADGFHRFQLPTVVYFDPRTIQPEILPELPAAFSLEEADDSAPPLLTAPVVEARPAPQPLPVMPHAEPALITHIRDLEQQTAAPPIAESVAEAGSHSAIRDSRKTRGQAPTASSVLPQPAAAAVKREESGQSLWGPAGIGLLVLVVLAFVRRWVSRMASAVPTRRTDAPHPVGELLRGPHFHSRRVKRSTAAAVEPRPSFSREPSTDPPERSRFDQALAKLPERLGPRKAA